ncbi:hypothetical protein PILCRDRAFT_489538 [Piloderma croceum F 1598]|uniref:Uncharacterized protein n=1 Tax=Piloderma croceum (strain F 1598) TaxID=765440 RepID=A0A0C3B6B4_PILCF|nr:hypothetical protein PILCRDRAFT_489538 [Piloderma croceum F 1598]
MWSQTEGRQLCRLVGPKCMTCVYPMATTSNHHHTSDGVSLEYLDERDHLPSPSEVPGRSSLALLVESPVFAIAQRDLQLSCIYQSAVFKLYCGFMSHTLVDQNTNRQNTYPCINPFSLTLDPIMSRLEQQI